MRRSFTVLGVCAAVLAMGGCHITRVPIHSHLSDAELDRRLGDRFLAGMAAEDAEIELNRLALEHTEAALPARDGSGGPDTGVRVMVRPPGVRFALGEAEARSDTMYLWFDGEGRLERLGDERSHNVEPVEDADRGLRLVPLGTEVIR